MPSFTLAGLVLVVALSSLVVLPQLAVGQTQSCNNNANTCIATGSYEEINGVYYCCPGCSSINFDGACSCSGCSSAPPPTTYSWVETGQGACTQSCGGGSQSISWQCEDENGNAAAASNCGTEPATSQSCNTQACSSYSWMLTGTTQCSASCGGGTQTTQYQCEDQNGNVVSSSNCPTASPAATSACNTQACTTTSSAPWTGTFAPQGQCNQGTCCCLVDTFTISQSGSDYILEGPVAGACGTTTAMRSSGTYPSGYSFSTQLGNDRVVISLSADGSTITEVDETSATCGGTAVRTGTGHTNGASTGFTNLSLFLAALLPLASMLLLH